MTAKPAATLRAVSEQAPGSNAAYRRLPSGVRPVDAPSKEDTRHGKTQAMVTAGANAPTAQRLHCACFACDLDPCLHGLPATLTYACKTETVCHACHVQSARLEQRRQEALVEPRDAALRVQRPEGVPHRPAVPVLRAWGHDRFVIISSWMLTQRIAVAW